MQKMWLGKIKRDNNEEYKTDQIKEYVNDLNLRTKYGELFMTKMKKYGLLLAYAIVNSNDSHIHSEQVRLLEKYLKKDLECLENAFQIIKEQYDKSDIQYLINELHNEKTTVIKSFQKKILYIQCMDGSFDDSDREFYCNIFKGSCPDEKLKKRYLGIFKYKVCNTRKYFRLLDFRKSFFNKIWFKIFSVSNRTLFSEINNIIYETNEFISNCLNDIIDISEISDIKLNDEPSIAVVGKTRAGKSTLFYLLSGQGKRLIGESAGSQRTTRYNMVTHLNGVKWIDTPGLGSSDPEGIADERKAQQMAEQSDYICFVMTDDPYYDNIRNSLYNILKLNKPVSILINCKTQANNDCYKEVSKKIYDWINKTNENSFKDLVNQIKKDVQESNLSIENIDLSFYPMNLKLACPNKSKRKRNKCMQHKCRFLKNLKYKKISGFFEMYSSVSFKISRSYLIYRLSYALCRLKTIYNELECQYSSLKLKEEQQNKLENFILDKIEIWKVKLKKSCLMK